MNDKLLALIILISIVVIGYLILTNFMWLMQWIIFPVAVIYALLRW